MEAYLTENCPPTFHFRGRAPSLPFQLHPAAALCQRLENAINTSVFNSSSLQKGGVGSIWLCTRVRVPWPLAARCLAVCVEPFVMFLPDGGGGGTHRASRNVALIVFFWLFGFWHPAAYQANLCQDDSRIWTCLLWSFGFQFLTNALSVQKFRLELGGVIHQQILDLFVCVN